MAAWLAKDPKRRKDCEKCRQLRDASNYLAGAQVNVAEQLGDCAKCEVMRAQPSYDNEPILEAYVLLPSNYDGWTGSKVIRYEEVMKVFEMMKLSPDRYDDYYKRLMFFHEQLVSLRSQERERESKRKGVSNDGAGPGS